MNEITREGLLKLIEDHVADGNSWHSLAIKSGVSYANLMDFKRGKADVPRAKNLAKLLTILSPHSGFSTSAYVVPVTGYVGKHAQVTFLTQAASGMAEPSNKRSVQPSALEVRSDSLEPLITEGFQLIYDERVHGVPAEFLNKICIVQVSDGPCLVARIKKGSRVGRYHLQALNPKEKPLENAAIEWSAFVKQMIQS